MFGLDFNTNRGVLELSLSPQWVQGRPSGRSLLKLLNSDKLRRTFAVVFLEMFLYLNEVCEEGAVLDPPLTLKLQNGY